MILLYGLESNKLDELLGSTDKDNKKPKDLAGLAVKGLFRHIDILRNKPSENNQDLERGLRDSVGYLLGPDTDLAQQARQIYHGDGELEQKIQTFFGKTA